MRRMLTVALLALPWFAAPGPARADEVGDAIAEAGRAWQGGDGAAARAALEEALQLLAQRAAAGLAAALPAPLPGWTAAAAESSAAAAGLLGGGTQASRAYRNAEGRSLRIQVMSDSPLMAQLGMILTNPAMAGMVGKLIRIGPQRAVQTNDNEIQMLVDNRILVTVTGDAPLDAKLAYARAVDIAALSGRR